MQNDNDEDAMKAFQIVRHYSLLLDSMEFAEDLENAKEEDIRFVSRYGWEDKRKMARFIAQHSKNIDSVPVFSLEELAKSSEVLFPFIPNLKKDEFMHYLTDKIGFDELNAYIVCFNLWYYKIHYGEYSLDDMPMEVYFLSRVLAEIDQDLTDRRKKGYRDLLTLSTTFLYGICEASLQQIIPLKPLSQRYRLRSRWVLC